MPFYVILDLIIVDSQAKHSNVDFIQEIYPKFCKLYEWFINTQSGQISSYDYGGSYTIGFKWRGRKGSHILTSGLDDYPRSKTAHLGDLHVDLLSWMAYFANILQETSDYLGLKKESLRFSNDFNAMMKTLQG